MLLLLLAVVAVVVVVVVMAWGSPPACAAPSSTHAMSACTMHLATHVTHMSSTPAHVPMQAESMRKQAMHEFVLAKALVHPNIVSTYRWAFNMLGFLLCFEVLFLLVWLHRQSKVMAGRPALLHEPSNIICSCPAATSCSSCTPRPSCPPACRTGICT